MAAESYEYYLRLLKLPRTAPEKDIRAAITNELRILTRRVNSPKLELRQEAERMIATLEAAPKVLLGPEGQIIRQKQGDGQTTVEEAQPELSVDAETVARAIERLAYARGRKAQERKGTVRYKRATIFYNGIEYLVEELVHKKYQAAQDRKRCCATQGALVLFDWYAMTADPSGQGNVQTYVPGPWVADLITIAAELETE
jgi:hypothetical protein